LDGGLERERRYLQRVVAVAGLVPVSAGLYGVLLGGGLTGDALSVSADSHFRYLSGLLLGIGLIFWSTIPRIETATRLFRILTLIVALGGLGRLLGLALTGRPALPMLAGLAMELVVTPLICLWQARVAARHADRAAERAPPV
jgi:hypothetical protein